MEKCKQCNTAELSDYEEFKYNLCWTCMSNNMDIIEKNPNIAEIKDVELLQKNEKKDSFSVVIRDINGTTLKMAANKKKHPLSGVLDGDGNEEDLSKPKEKVVPPKEKVVPPKEKVVPPKEKVVPPKEKVVPPVEPSPNNLPPDNEDVTTTPKNGKEKKLIEDEEGLKVVRESKEILTKADRAKMRAYALINKALKETGQFELSVVLTDTHETVSSAPYKEKNIEDVIMTTTMEVLDPDIINNKKKK
jgi:hypothetical protein